MQSKFININPNMQKTTITVQRATETYTGLTRDQYSAYESQDVGIPLPKPAPMPSLVPFKAKVTMDASARLPSTWRSAIGPILTNKRIIEYQREGRYGSGLKLPALSTSKTCCIKGCNSNINTRQCDYAYLPQAGVYCKHHRMKYKDLHTKAIEEAKRLKELELITFVNEYV